MPTPSLPETEVPPTFSTCPDPDDSSRLPFTNVEMPTYSPHTPVDRPEEDDASPRSDDNSSGPHFDNSDGPVSDADANVDAPDSIRSGRAYNDSHKTIDVQIDRTESPCEPSPIESITTPRLRHGVGTSYARDFNAPPTSRYSPRTGYEMEQEFSLPSMGYGFPSRRVVPSSPSSFLRAGSRFTGTQQSERQVYDVQVEIKHVDLHESFLCGYLRIQGLTDDHPTLTTYFEGEIIGTKYGFMTKHDSWGANDKTDLSHWSKFPAFRPYAKQARRGSSVMIKDVAQSEHIFMRWKEHFLVPDHRVRTISGASFEGFYYICFNQVQGEVNGIYFHSKSERFQQLELKHVEDRGCYSALEFR